MPHKDTVIGLGDGGAHYGMICDSSYTTFMLGHWTRDRIGRRFGVPEIVNMMTRRTAEVVGLRDRGLIALGYKADINVIDYDGIKLHRPFVVRDLPGGGQRLDQRADGYIATIVSGQIIAERGVPTSHRPGKLIRGAKEPKASQSIAA
jgi:N-acyl-D-aspartate/D-glutamate deacylase